jgi:integrase
MASIRYIRPTKRKSRGTWQARWRERGRSCAKNFSTEKAAKAHMAKMALLEDRGVGDPERLRTSAFFAAFLAEVEANAAYSPATLIAYTKMLSLGARVIGDIPLGRLTTTDVANGLSSLLEGDKPCKRTTVHYAHRILVLALNAAVRRGLIAFNPAMHALPTHGRIKKGAPRKVRVFDPDEVTALLAAAKNMPDDTQAIVHLLFATGLRRAELCGLTLDDIDLDAGHLHVRGTIVEVNHQPVARDRGKSAAALRTLALPPSVVELLRAQRARVLEMALGSGMRPVYLFPAAMGRPMPPEQLTTRLKRLMRAAGITDARAPCHTWRHTSATVTFDASTNIKLVQTRLGHADIRTTMGLYVHTPAEREREAADHFERLLNENKGESTASPPNVAAAPISFLFGGVCRTKKL